MVPKTLLVVLLVLLSYYQADGARILGIVPTPSFSHQVAFRQLWEALSLRGHEVVVMTTDPMNKPQLTNLTEIDLHFSYDVMNTRNNISEMLAMSENNPLRFIEYFRKVTLEVADEQLMSPKVQDLLHEKQHFDVVLSEIFYAEMLAFGELFDCPTIFISSLDGGTMAHQTFGNPAHPVLYPDVVLPFSFNLSFKQRLSSVFYSFYMKYFRKIKMAPGKQMLIEKHFGNVTKNIDELVANVDMMFINVNPVLHQRPHGATTILIGGGNHITKPSPLPKDIQSFLDSATNGAIYFSLGSNVKSKFINREMMQIIMDTFKELPYKVLWKFENDELPGKPDNVKIMKWGPQQDILRHPNVKLFITQGGFQSMEEAIFCHMPMVVMPFFADQQRNADLIVNKGIGVWIGHKPLVKEVFKNAIIEVIKNPKYRTTVKKLADLSQDEPMTGVERGVWWTEYVIRHKGAKHLRDPALDIPFYQYFFLDILGFISVILFIVFSIVKRVFRLICTKKIQVVPSKKTQ